MTRRALATTAAVLALVASTAAGCGGDDDGAASGDTTVTEAVPPATETMPGTTDTTGTTDDETTGSTDVEADRARGKALFTDNGCGGCHTLSDAGTNGTVGPSLDESAVDQDAAETQIHDGGNGMPAFGDRLSEDEIETLAAYVVAARS